MERNVVNLSQRQRPEPLDNILHSLITSISLTSTDTAIIASKENVFDNLQKTDMSEFKKDKNYPNFWPSQLFPDLEESKRENIAKKKPRFMSKSANKSGSNKFTSSTAKHNHPKTARPLSNIKDGVEEFSEDEHDTNWMKILEKRSGKDRHIIQTDNKDGHKIQEEHYIDIENEQDDSSSFMTEFPPREICTAGSSEATSIGWADDAIESQSTDLLARQWAEVEKVFHGEDIKPEGMSDAVYQEALLWRRAFNTPKLGSQSTYNFDKNSNMSISLHIKDNYPNFIHEEDPELLSPMSLLPTLNDYRSNNKSPDLESDNSEASVKKVNGQSSSGGIELPPTIDAGTSFVQSWLENLTVNYGNDDDDQYQADEPMSLPVKFGQDRKILQSAEFEFDESESYERTSGKVQRPISSQYLNRSMSRTKDKITEPIRSLKPRVDLDLDLDFLQLSPTWNVSTGFEEDSNNRSPKNSTRLFNATTSRNLDQDQQPSAFTRCSSRTRKLSATSTITANNLTWSRYAHSNSSAFRPEEDVQESGGGINANGKRTPQHLGRNRTPARKNFISWLLFDEKDENNAHSQESQD